ncbi:type II toxin-antitoxin system RelE/ParE family toxin [Achromobacter seleniivolatilans]|uniref:Type II toxin-antitoxin system RelE/ParE family toxin n=1 Tax=Achromobacter seleniivolatilans TaxID=3047478 RepID=A0ABY9LUE2_9BURK|nr:type II toxin-antitoxin system RelE/ParE family toxin [Achromobacter sp. R39]WMD18162.1 type II toxin-antitoxin system RelE/ParE family toxin [Achromobacter sp. R39]
MFSINWAKRAVRQWLKIPKTDRNRITAEVAKLKSFPHTPNIRALVNHEFGYRLRVGQYRIIFDVHSVIRIIEIQEVKKRDDSTYRT